MGTGRKLLLADDSITIQKVVNLTFADEGLDVTTVGNGDLAIEMIQEIAPDIVLADIHMPGLNGYEVCEFVKRNERFRHIPVMLLVGSFEPFDEAEARRVGADDHLTKPFQSIRQLVSKVGALLSGKSAGDETPTKELSKRSDEESNSELRGDATMEPDPTFAPDVSGEVASVNENSSDAFADPTLDDALIEATPVGDFNMNRTTGGAQHSTTPLSTADLDEAGLNRAHSSAIHVKDTIQMHSGGGTSEDTEARDSVDSQSAEKVRAVAADDSLLDLGDAAPQVAANEDDEFILDIWDDAPDKASSTFDGTAESPLVQYDGDMTEVSAPATQVAAVDVIQDVPIVEAAPINEPESEAVMVEPVVDAKTVSQPHSGLITLEQLAPEVIDAIARRAVEQLSEKVIEQIAWEVVPELAERLIKRRLEEEGKP